jgi:hypothetical protein
MNNYVFIKINAEEELKCSLRDEELCKKITNLPHGLTLSC